MIRLAASPTPVRSAAALAGALGVLALAGCAPANDANDTTNGADAATTAPTASTAPAAPAAPGASTTVYTDGSYTATGSYRTPESVEQLTVTLTIAGDEVTAVEVEGEPSNRESEQYQAQFASGIEAVVVGKSIDELNLSRVAGSSLTSGGFNDALEQIKADAKA